jgi:hypothetical protein
MVTTAGHRMWRRAALPPVSAAMHPSGPADNAAEAVVQWSWRFP